jgi:hypothetical protein
MTYTVNAEKYRCVKYQYKCTADTASTCTQAQIQVGVQGCKPITGIVSRQAVCPCAHGV